LVAYTTVLNNNHNNHTMATGYPPNHYNTQPFSEKEKKRKKGRGKELFFLSILFLLHNSDCFRLNSKYPKEQQIFFSK